jgi:hypothetical protein
MYPVKFAIQSYYGDKFPLETAAQLRNSHKNIRYNSFYPGFLVPKCGIGAVNVDRCTT